MELYRVFLICSFISAVKRWSENVFTNEDGKEVSCKIIHEKFLLKIMTMVKFSFSLMLTVALKIDFDASQQEYRVWLWIKRCLKGYSIPTLTKCLYTDDFCLLYIVSLYLICTCIEIIKTSVEGQYGVHKSVTECNLNVMGI